MLAMLVAACGASTVATTPSPVASLPVSASASAAPPALATAAATATDAWAADITFLDKMVRQEHVSPFTIHSEAEWNAKLAEIGPKLAGAGQDEQLVLVASLVGLLDTHTYMGTGAGFHFYDALFYRFSDGWYVIAAADPALVGTRLISIGGHGLAAVEDALRPLIPHDNESGFWDNEDVFSKVEYLHGSGIVDDPAAPQYVLERPDGTRVTVDHTTSAEDAWVAKLGITGDLVGGAPEAVARRGERVWTRLDDKHKAFLVSVNDYGDMSAAATALKAALDSGRADRVVLDIRYLRGGSGDFGLFDLLKNDPRVNRKGGLTVLIGRENVSVATLIDYEFDVHTQALLVGEPTPARADNFRCACDDIELKHSGIVVTVPTDMSHNGDMRPEIVPDNPMSLGAADFFAGRDPVLDAALKGLRAP
jgi:hypothetical protein